MISIDITDNVLKSGNLTWTPAPMMADLWEKQPKERQDELVAAYRERMRNHLHILTLLAMHPHEQAAAVFYDKLYREFEERFVAWLSSQPLPRIT